jgi:small multidrug resistance pump
LAAAISLEVVATLNLKASEGFSRFWPSVVVVFGYVGCFLLMGTTLKDLDVGLVYAIWSGVGTVAVVMTGFALFGEPLSTGKVLGMAVIIAGVVVVNLSQPPEPTRTAADGTVQLKGRHVEKAGDLASAQDLKAVRHGTRR